MIPDFKTYLNESVWSDMRKKSLGKEERMEGDVNLMDRDAFFGYLKDHYEYIGPGDPHLYGLNKSKPNKGSESIFVPVYMYPPAATYRLFIEFDGDRNRFLSIKPFKGRYIMLPYVGSKPISNKLKEKFKIEEVYEIEGFDRKIGYYNIMPNDGGEKDNKFFLEVINFIINNLEEPLKTVLVKK